MMANGKTDRSSLTAAPRVQARDSVLELGADTLTSLGCSLQGSMMRPPGSRSRHTSSAYGRCDAVHTKTSYFSFTGCGRESLQSRHGS